MQTGTVWQERRRVFEMRPSWPADASSVFLYWVHTNSSGHTPRWILGPVVGSSREIWAFVDSEALSPAELVGQNVKWHVLHDGVWSEVAPHMAVTGREGIRWWSELQRRRNQSSTGFKDGDLLLSNSVHMPSVGCGTDSVPSGGLTSMLKAGCRLLDSAMVYQREVEMGKAIKDVGRENVFIVSKVWHSQLGFDSTLGAMKTALEKLGTSYIDLLLIHWPRCYPQLTWMQCGSAPSKGTWQQSWRSLERLYAEGRVRAVGISNFDYDTFWEAVVQMRPAVKAHVVQNWFDPLHTDDSVRDLATKQGVQYMGYSPLRNTFSSTTDASGGEAESPYSRVRATAERIAKEVGKSPAQVLFGG